MLIQSTILKGTLFMVGSYFTTFVLNSSKFVHD